MNEKQSKQEKLKTKNESKSQAQQNPNKEEGEQQASEYLVSKGKELASNSSKDFAAIFMTNPAVVYLFQARANVTKFPEKSSKEVLKETAKPWKNRFLEQSFSSKGEGQGVLRRRMCAFVLVGSVGDTMMSDILPNPDGLDSPAKVATIGTRALAKGGMESFCTAASEALTLHKFYSSKQPITEFTKGVGLRTGPRNSLIQLGVEAGRATEHDHPLKAAAAGGAIGMVSGFAAGVWDNAVTLSYAAASSGQVAKPLSANQLLFAGTLRAAQAAVTAAGLAGVMEMPRFMSGGKKENEHDTPSETSKQQGVKSNPSLSAFSYIRINPELMQAASKPPQKKTVYDETVQKASEVLTPQYKIIKEKAADKKDLATTKHRFSALAGQKQETPQFPISKIDKHQFKKRDYMQECNSSQVSGWSGVVKKGSGQSQSKS